MPKLTITRRQQAEFFRRLHMLMVLQERAEFAVKTVAEGANCRSETYEAIEKGLDLLHEAFPTFLLVKLGALLEDLLNAILARQLPIPAKSIKRLAFDVKIQTLEGLHPTQNIKRLKQLRDLRNKCAHDFMSQAIWEEFEE